MPDNSIDSLQIELKASAQSASKSITALEAKIRDLSSALSGINTTRLSNLAVGVSQLSSAMQGMNAVKTTDFTRLAKNLNSIGNISSSSLAVASDNILKFSQSLQSLSGISIGSNAQQITELTTAIRGLGLKSAQNAVDNIPKLADSLKKLLTTLSTAPKVNSSVVSLTASLAKLSTANSKIIATTPNARSYFDTVYSGANKSASSVKSLAYYFGKLYANFWLLFRVFRKLGEAIDLSSQLTELQNVVDVTFGNMANKLDDMASSSIEKFGMSELTLKQIASRYQAMGSAMDISNDAVKRSSEFLSKQNAIYDESASSMADVSIQLTKLTADMASFYDVSQTEVADNLASIFTGTTRPLRKYGIDLTQATLKEWALSQGLDADIKNMTQAEKAMLRYQYVMAHTTNAMGDFTRTSQTWANQIRILKQNFQQLAIVIGNTLVNAFKPFIQAMNQVMAKVIAFAQTVYNALGKIFGWRMEIKNTGVTDELGGAEDATEGIDDNLGSASKNAKKLKDNLLGIDELNIISPNDDDSGSGSGSGLNNAGGGGLDFDESKTDSMFDKFKSDIDSLFELGRWISNALADMLESIDWDAIYKKAERFGKGLADFLNGLITPRLFGDLGDTIAKALNTALHFLDSFGEEFGWERFGLSLATGLNHFFESFDWSLLAHTINVWANGLLDTIIVFLEKTDWKMIGTKIGTFLAEINFLEIGKKVGKAIWEAINAGVNIYRGMFSKAPFETILITLGAIPTLVKSIMGLGITQKLISLGVTLGTMGKALTGSATALNSLGVIGRTVVAVLGALGKGANAFSVSMAFGLSATDGMRNAFTAMSGVIGGLEGALLSVISVFAEFFVVKNAIEELYTGTSTLGETFAELIPVITAVGVAMTMVLGFPAGIIATAIVGLVGAIVGMKEAFEEIDARNLGETIAEAFTNPNGVNLIDAIGSVIDGVREIGDSFDTVSEKADAFNQAGEKVDGLVEEINKIGIYLDAGVISTEEASEKLIDLYGQLGDAIAIRLSSAEDVILSYFGENSAISQALEAQGVQVSKLREDVVKDMSETQKSAYDLTQELNSLLSDPVGNADRIEEIKNQLIQLNSGFDDTSAVVEDFSLQLKNNPLDWSEFINEDGLDIEGLKSALNGLTTEVDDAYTKIDESSVAVNEALNQIADEETRQQLKTAMAQGMDGVKDVISSKSTDITDAMQTEVIGGINDVIKGAEEDWKNLSWADKFFKYNDDEDAYILAQVQKYKESTIDPLSQVIEEGFAEVGVEGAGWASEATQEIIDSLFDVTAVNEEGTVFATTLKDEYSKIIDESVDGLEAKSKAKHEELGKWGAEGYADGFDKEVVNDAVESVMLGAIEVAKNAQDSHSPSEKYKELGLWAVQGYSEGIEENKEIAFETLRTWIEEMMMLFSGEEEGTSIFDGIKLAWENFTLWWTEEAVPTWYEEQVVPWFSLEKWLEIAEGMKKGIKQRWDETSKQWQTDLKNWWDNHVAPWFKLEKWTKLLETVPQAFKQAFNQAGNFAIDAMNNVINAVVQMVEEAIRAIEALIKSATSVEGVEISFSPVHPSASTIPHFATGGFPEDGLFFANHSEMVGQFSNGKTAVVNNAQIVEGIASGVERVLEQRLVPYLEDISSSSRITSEKETSVELDGRELVNALQSRSVRNGFAF